MRILTFEFEYRLKSVISKVTIRKWGVMQLFQCITSHYCKSARVCTELYLLTSNVNINISLDA
jgi:hypothetical protein